MNKRIAIIIASLVVLLLSGAVYITRSHALPSSLSLHPQNRNASSSYPNIDHRNFRHSQSNPQLNPKEDARRVIAGYLQAIATGNAGALQSYIWRYADTSASQPPVKKDEIQGRLAAVELQGGFRMGGLDVGIYRAEMVPGGPLFFTLVQEPGDKKPQVATVRRKLVNTHYPVEARWQEDAKETVYRYFKALEQRDFADAVRWVHPTWCDLSAMPDRELRSLRLLSIRFCNTEKVGRVILLEYAVEAWTCYPRSSTRLSGRNIYFVTLAPLAPPVPAEWRIVCIGSGP